MSDNQQLLDEISLLQRHIKVLTARVERYSLSIQQRERRINLPTAPVFVFLFTALVAIVSIPFSMIGGDEFMVLLIPLVIFSALEYPRWVYLATASMLIGFTVLVIFTASFNLRASMTVTVTISVVMLSICELLYRLSQQRTLVETALLEQEKNYRLLANNVVDAIWTMDIRGHFTYVSPAAEKIFGYTPDEMLGQRITDILGSDSSQAASESLRGRIEQGLTDPRFDKPERLETQLRRKNGSLIWVETISTPMRDEKRQFMGILGVTRDITDRRRMEHKQRESERRYKEAVQNAPNPIFAVDFYGMIQTWNRASEETFQYGPESIGQHYRRLFATDRDYNYVNNMVMDVFNHQSIKETNLLFTCRDQSQRQMIARLYPIKDEDGQVQMCVFANTDITEREQTQETLRDNEEKFRSVVEQSHDAIHLINAKGEIIEWNRASERITGYLRDEMIGRSIFELKPQLISESELFFFEQWQKDLREAVQIFGNRPQSQTIEYDVQCKDGSTRTLQQVIFPIHTRKGIIIGAVSRDITEQKKTQEALRESEELFRQIAENVHEIFYVRDVATMKYIYVNPAYEQVVGRPAQELIDNPENFLSYIHPDDAETVRELVQKRQQHLPSDQDRPSQLVDISYRIIRPDDKEIRWIESHMFAVKNKEGLVYRVIGIVEDITERKESEERSIDLHLERERMQLLANFIRTGAHQFRTPLSVINTKVHLIKHLSDESRRLEHADGIKQQSDRIAELVDALMLMTSLDANVPLNEERIALKSILAMLRDSLLNRFKQKQVHLHFSIEPDLPFIKGDAVQLNHALHQLMNNALRYTDSGGTVTVEASLKDDCVIITVRDTGSGIEAQHLPHIFESFYRADEAQTTAGFGLGLPIARRIIEKHGGHIEVESTAGQGSTFHVKLPLRPVLPNP